MRASVFESPRASDLLLVMPTHTNTHAHTHLKRVRIAAVLRLVESEMAELAILSTFGGLMRIQSFCG